jgi:hypothetical protein
MALLPVNSRALCCQLAQAARLLTQFVQLLSRCAAQHMQVATTCAWP